MTSVLSMNRCWMPDKPVSQVGHGSGRCGSWSRGAVRESRWPSMNRSSRREEAPDKSGCRSRAPNRNGASSRRLLRGSRSRGGRSSGWRPPMSLGSKAVLKPPHSKRCRDRCAAPDLAKRLECSRLQRRFLMVAAHLEAPARRGFPRGEMNRREHPGRL